MSISAVAQTCDGIIVVVPGAPPSCESDSDGDEIWDSVDHCSDTSDFPVDEFGCSESQRDLSSAPSAMSAAKPEQEMGKSKSSSEPSLLSPNLELKSSPVDFQGLLTSAPADGLNAPEASKIGSQQFILESSAGDSASGVQARAGAEAEKFILGGPSFDLSSSVLTPFGQQSLQPVIMRARKQSALLMNIYGYTDSSGGESFNLELSKLRAQAVAQYLISMGVLDLQVNDIDGFGAAHPRVPNDTLAQRILNRRVEIEFFTWEPELKTAAEPVRAGNKTVTGCGHESEPDCGTNAEVWVLPLNSFDAQGKVTDLARSELALLATALAEELRVFQSVQLAVRDQGVTQIIPLNQAQREKVIQYLTHRGVSVAQLPLDFRQGQAQFNRPKQLPPKVVEVMPTEAPTPVVSSAEPIPEQDEDQDGILGVNDQCPGSLEEALVGPEGCLIKQTIRIPGVLFLHQSSQLSDQGQQQLLQVARSLKQETHARVEIAAFTDNRGSFDFNLEVSQNRANAVASFLKQQGVPAKMIFSTKGYGSMNPIASNFDPEGRAANERIELNFIR